MANYPKHILFEKWADIGFSWEGDVPLVEFERLYGHLNPVAQNTNAVLHLNTHLIKKDGTVWLNANIQGVLWLDCHRCLEVMSEVVDDHYEMAIVRQESELPALEQQEVDYVFWSEIAQDGRMLPLFDMIEDELLLSLPLSNTHADCQMAVESVGEIIEEPKENPFAVLASLKSKN